MPLTRISPSVMTPPAMTSLLVNLAPQPWAVGTMLSRPIAVRRPGRGKISSIGYMRLKEISIAGAVDLVAARSLRRVSSGDGPARYEGGNQKNG
jgi:hypothetical protein